MPLVINSLGGGQTDTQTQTDRHTHMLRIQDQFLETRRANLWSARLVQKFPHPYKLLKASKITKTIQVLPSIETFPIYE